MKQNRVSHGKGGFMRARNVVITAAMLACLAAAARGTQCDTGNQCMTNGMCMPDGTCEGTPLNSGSCDLISDVLCEVNGHCVDGTCMGDPAPEGTSCASGCGTCQPIVPFPGAPLLCMANPAQLGQACETNLGACYTAVCTQQGVPPVAIAACIPQPKQCPDTDNNPCTTDACNPATGKCEHSNAPPCVPQCETCTPATGCQPANIGAACTSQGECPVESSCQVLAGHGLCLPGTPSSGGPTPTPTPTTNPTQTPTVMPSSCSGDCDHNGEVSVGEVVTMANITLETDEYSSCERGDADGDGVIRINDIVIGVDHALHGCPG